MNNQTFTALAGSACLVLSASLLASDWTGNESEDWFDSDNWTAGVPTASTNQVRINTSNPNSTLIDGGSAATGTLFGVGHNGVGELSLINGTTLVSESANLGSQLSGDGSVTISGAGSTWEVTSGNFDVGGSGIGLLEILDGGLLQTPTPLSRVGQQASGSGNVMVSGAGSVWALDGQLWLGVVGSGQMTIGNGGEVTFSGTSTLAQNNDSTGELIITGQGSRLSGTRLHVGNGATSGATMATGLMQLVDGGTLELVGSGGDGVLVIASNSRSEGTVVVGAPAGESPAEPGQLLIDTALNFSNGTGTLVFNHTGVLDMNFPVTGPINGSGHIQVENGTNLFAGENFDYSGSLAIEPGAVFGAPGQLGDVVNEGTLIASPGQAATLEIQGDYVHNEDAVIEIQFGPGPEIDLIEVAGEVTIGGGSVRFVVLPGNYGSEPIDGLYPFLTAAGGINGQFGQLDTNNPAAFQLVHDGDTVYVQVNDRLFQDRYQQQ